MKWYIDIPLLFLLNFKDNKNPLKNLKLFSGFYPINICLEID